MPQKRRDTKGRILRTGESQRPDGRYMYRYQDALGNRHTLYSWKLVEADATPAGKTCESSLREMEKEISLDLGENIKSGEASKTTMDSLFESMMGIRKDLKESTRINYARMYRIHISPVLGETPVKDVRSSMIQKLYTDMLVEQGIMGSTVKVIHSLLHEMLQMAEDDRLIRSNPSEPAIKKIKRVFDMSSKKKHALSSEQQKRFIEFVYGSSRFSRYGPLFTVMLGTGMRICEVLGLTWDDIDFKSGKISVNHALHWNSGKGEPGHWSITTPKTKAGCREILMLSDVKDALEKTKLDQLRTRAPKYEIDGYSGFVFATVSGKPMWTTQINDLLVSIEKAHNRAENAAAKRERREPTLLPHMSCHTMRHSLCTRLFENGIPMKVVQEVMGHKDASTTMNIYNDAVEPFIQSTITAIDGAIPLR